MDAGDQPGEPLTASDPRQVGPYEILSRLGAGAMGRVYLGQRPDGQRAAVKVVRADLAEVTVFRRRFARELDVVRKVGGEHVARVLDADANAEHPWIATECVDGLSLQQLVDSRGPLGVLALRALAADIARALRTIHDAGVVHRDLKPSNVLMAADGPKVIDFGVAQAADATLLTSTGHSPGTPAYMSPEQADGRPAVPASDVFALGSLLVFAATGRLAFGEGAPLAVLNKILNAEPDLTGVAVDDAELHELIAGCLSKEADDRPTPERIVDVCMGAGTTVVTGLRGRGPDAAVAGADGEERRYGVAGVRDGGPGAAAAEAGGEGRRFGATGRNVGIAGGILVAIVAVLIATSAGGGSDHKSGTEAGAAVGNSPPAATPSESGGAVFPAGSDGATDSAGSSISSGGLSGTGVGAGGSASAGSTLDGGHATNSAPGGAHSTTAGSTASTLKPAQPATSAPAVTTTTVAAPKTVPPKVTTTTPPPPVTTTAPPANQPPASPSYKVTQNASFGIASFSITWTAPSDVTGYDIDVNGQTTNVAASSSPYSFTEAFGANVCVKMRAINQYGASGWAAFKCFTA